MPVFENTPKEIQDRFKVELTHVDEIKKIFGNDTPISQFAVLMIAEKDLRKMGEIIQKNPNHRFLISEVR